MLIMLRLFSDSGDVFFEIRMNTGGWSSWYALRNNSFNASGNVTFTPFVFDLPNNTQDIQVRARVEPVVSSGFTDGEFDFEFLVFKK